MKAIYKLVCICVAFCACAGASHAQTAASRTFSKASELYEAGLYSEARNLFETLKGDRLAEGYAVLCAVRMRSGDFESALEEYEATHTWTTVSDELNYRYALILFEQGKWEEAARRFDEVKPALVSGFNEAEFQFKRGYCDYARGMYQESATRFRKVESLPMNDYKAPARYALGYMAYSAGNPDEALKWFGLSVKDPRFEDVSRFYMIDCKFVNKDYDYVLSEGIEYFKSAPASRRARLARMIAESYLVKGDKASAREYYSVASQANVNRSDYFFSGSLLYAVEDYAGAIENFEKMTERTDSIGQIANYQLGNCYIRTRNKVAALDAFKAAAQVDWNLEMKEDAHFNYAKLAFDINKDTSGFTSYIKRYSTARRGDMIYGYMALASLYDKDYAAAVDAYDHIDELAPDMQSNYVKAYYLRAAQLIDAGVYRDAVPCLKAAAYYLPGYNRLSQLSRYWQAECAYRTENYADALKIYSDLYNISALTGQKEGDLIPYNAAYCHYRLQEFDQAARWFDLYISESGKLYREDALTRRADCDFARGDYKAAVASYDAVMEEFGAADNIYPYYQQALAYGLITDRHDRVSKENKLLKVKALSRVEDASPKAPMYEEALYELGRAYMDVSDNKNAIEVFTRLNTTATDNTYRARALIGLGMVSRNSSDYDEALAYYKQVVSLMPGSSYAEDALLAIESIYQTRKESEKYLEYVEQNNLAADKTEAEKENMYFNTAEQIFLAGNYLQAASSLQRFLDLYPETSHKTDVLFYMAESYKALGNKEKASDLYSKVIEAAPQGSYYESSILSYAELAYSMEHFGEAYASYGTLLEKARIEDNRKTAKCGMMRSAYRGREFEKAISAADSVLAVQRIGDELRREAGLIKGKSLQSCSRRDEATAEFRTVALEPSTPEGAEARYLLVQDAFNRGDFDSVQSQVFDFSDKAGGQSYWLARAYITLADSFVEKGAEAQAKATYESVRDGYDAMNEDDDIPAIVEARLLKLQQK